MEMVSVSLIDRDTYTYLEGMLGWLSVRRMIITVTMRTPVRLAVLRSGAMQGIGVRWRRRATPVSIVTAVVHVFDAILQVQAGHGRRHRRRPRKLLVHTTTGLGRALSVHGGDGAVNPSASGL